MFAVQIFIFFAGILNLACGEPILEFLAEPGYYSPNTAILIKEEIVSAQEFPAPTEKPAKRIKECKVVYNSGKYLFMDTKNPDNVTLYSFPDYWADYIDSVRFINVFPIMDASGLFDFSSLYNIVALSINPRSTLEFFLGRAKSNNCKLDFSGEEMEINSCCGNYSYKIYFSGKKITKIDVLKNSQSQLLTRTTLNYGNGNLPDIAHVEYFYKGKAAIRKTLSFCIISGDFNKFDANLLNVDAIGAVKILDGRFNPPRTYFFKHAIPNISEAESALKDPQKQELLNTERKKEIQSARKSNFILNIQKIFKEAFKGK